MATPIQHFPQIQGTKAFAITASDTVDIKGDAANFDDVPFVYLHCTGTSGTCKVLPAGQAADPVTIYLTQGQVFPMAVRRVYATSPTPPTVIGIY